MSFSFARGQQGFQTGAGSFVENAGPDLFGGISSYGLCAGCGRFHGVQDAGDGGQGVIINSDDRGGQGPNGKPSLGTIDAGLQLTRSGLRWGGGAMGTAATVTYAFRNTSGTMPDDTAGFTNFTTAQIAATLQALASWSDVANITFQRVQDAGSEYSDNAAMLFGNYASGVDGAAAFAYFPGSTASTSNSGNVWVNASLSYNATPVRGAYGQLVLVHEIGHAIGLSHPADYNAGDDGDVTYNGSATYFEDSLQYTVMSYFDERFTGADFLSGNFAAAPMLDDIAAAQRLYGANMTTRTGDTVYGFNSNAGASWFSPLPNSTAMIFAIWDAGGTDTLDFSGYSGAQTIDLRQGAFSSTVGLTGNIAIALGAVIENAIGGSGADTIHGNSANNRITGGLGNDIIDGGLGEDTVVFSGNRSDYSISTSGVYLFVWGPNGEVDRVINAEWLQFADTTIAAPYDPYSGVSVTGDATNDTINGTVYNDSLSGGGGNDTLNGLDGRDTLNGGPGNDILNAGEGDDTLIAGLGDDALNGGGGYDVAYFHTATGSLNINLATGIASGGGLGTDTLSGIEEIVGGTYNDTLRGDGADNVIRGGGGIDTIHGGGGNDTLYAGAPGLSGGAPDIVKAGGTAISSRETALTISNTTAFDLLSDPSIANSTGTPHATIRATSSGAVTEWYAVTMTAGGVLTLDIDNAAFDSVLVLYDAAGNEVARNDDSATDPGTTYEAGMTFTAPSAGVYYIQVARWQTNTGDTFTFQPLTAGATYTLHISSTSATPVALNVTGSTIHGDDGDDTIHGSTGFDVLSGNAGNDIIYGNGGGDHLGGGTGDDVFYVGVGDIVFEGVGEGYDHVNANASHYLYANVEALTLTSASLDSFGVGNELANVITGNNSANLLIGGGGDDTLYGRNGDDRIFGEDGNDTLWGELGTDILVGGAGNDILRGDSGGQEGDFLYGGADNDIYYVDRAEDLTFEDAGGGYDTVYADVQVAGAAVYLYANVEALVLVGRTTYGVGNALDNTLTGSDSVNWLLGGAGNDVLNGKGGYDVLFGEGGRDTFVFEVGTGGDVIGDFSIADDFIDLTGFSNLGNFATIQGRFVQNGADGAIDLGNGDFVVLNGVTMANLTAANFVFGQGSAPASPTATVIKDAGPLVLPGLIGGLDDDFLPGLAGKGHDMPLVLPGLAEATFAKDAGPLVLPAMSGDFDLSSGLAARDVFVFADAAPSLDGPRLGLEADHILHAHAQDPWAL